MNFEHANIFGSRSKRAGGATMWLKIANGECIFKKNRFLSATFFVAETWRTYAIRTSPTSPTHME
jgi:hypothetical protein